jgi:hypothetical protein
VIATLGSLCAGGWYERHLLHDTLWNVRAASWNLSETSKVLKDNSTETSTMEKKILGETSEFIKLTNVQVYGKGGHPGLVPQIRMLIEKSSIAMDDLDTAIKGLGELNIDVRSEIAAIRAATDELTGSIRDLRAFGHAENPKLNTMMDELLLTVRNIDADVRQLHELEASITATAEDVQQVADKIRAEYMKARNLYYAVAKELLGLGSEAVQFWLKK